MKNNKTETSKTDINKKKTNINKQKTDTNKKKPNKYEEQIKELKDKLIRQMAEFENFRKRNEIEKDNMYNFGICDILKKILPIIDSIERGFSSINKQDLKTNPIAKGLEMIYKQVTTILKDIGVKEIKTVNEKFNSNLHNAVMHEENSKVGENVIVEELQKGYIYKDKILRHSMVKVAN